MKNKIDIKLLIVDDDEDIIEVLTQYFFIAGFSTTACSDGIEAIPLLKTHHFDVLVTDIHMPHIDGITLLEWTRRHCPDIPIIVISGDGPLSEELSLEKGASLYLEKPFDMNLLIDRINSLVTQSYYKAGNY